eukprot:5848471-Prymnesium_polylepis.1
MAGTLTARHPARSSPSSSGRPSPNATARRTRRTQTAATMAAGTARLTATASAPPSRPRASRSSALRAHWCPHTSRPQVRLRPPLAQQLPLWECVGARAAPRATAASQSRARSHFAWPSSAHRRSLSVPRHALRRVQPIGALRHRPSLHRPASSWHRCGSVASHPKPAACGDQTGRMWTCAAASSRGRALSLSDAPRPAPSR